MHDNERNRSYFGFFALATFVLVVLVLRAAQAVLVPIAIASILAFLLTPVVQRFTRFGLPKILSVSITTILAFAVVGGVGWIVTTQAFNLMRQLPSYEKNIEAKVSRLKPLHESGAYARVQLMEERIRKDLAPASAPADVQGHTVVPVEVQTNNRSMPEVVRDFATPLLDPLGRAFIVVVFVVGILLQRDDLRNRFIKIVSPAHLNVANQAVSDATARVYRYLAVQVAINACFGVVIGTGLFFIGIPSAVLWGLLAMLLRFIPFLGPWMAAACPLILAVAIDPGWMKALYAFGLYFAVELITANLIENWLYGVSTGTSNLALMVAAVFWTWLWGLPGLFLSTPLTVCLVVMGKHVPGLNLISVLLGSDPVLEPPAQFYHRMLAMDSEGMLDIAVNHVKGHSLGEFYSQVFVPALILAEEDRHNGALAEIRQTFILESGRELIDELQRRSKAMKSGGSVPPLPLRAGPTQVLGVPAHDEADQLVGLMVRHLLAERGISSEVSATTSMTGDSIALIEKKEIKVAYVSALPPDALAPARQVTRRLKDRCPGLRVIVGVWSSNAKQDEIKERLIYANPDDVVIDLTDAVALIEKCIDSATSVSSQPVQPPSAEGMNTEGLGLGRLAPEERFDAVSRDVAHYFQVPVSFTSVNTTDVEFWKQFSTHRSNSSPTGDGSKTSALSDLGMQSDDLLVIDDVRKDARFSGNSSVKERGICFYALIPLRTSEERVVGNICIVDTKPRQIGEPERALLRARAGELMKAVESGAEAPEAAEPASDLEAGPNRRL